MMSSRLTFSTTRSGSFHRRGRAPCTGGASAGEPFKATLLTGAVAVGSYDVGANIPGKATGPRFYFGGAPKYFREIDSAADGGHEGFAIDAHRPAGADLKRP